MTGDEKAMPNAEIPASTSDLQEATAPQKEEGAEVPDAAAEQPGEGSPSKQPPGPVVAIGASAGGLEALQEFFSNISSDTGIAFVVVTHVRPGRESLLPELIGATTAMSVIHADDSTRIRPNQVIVARDSLLSIEGGVLRPIEADGKSVTYHPIDHFFRALADDQREHAIGIILSGSGSDGSVGLKAIKAAGGMIMVQNPDTAKYSGMPDSAIASHLADYVLSPKELPAALVEYCSGPFLRLTRRAEDPGLPDEAIQGILVRLRAHRGQDFTCYKKSTMSRRIRRRMNVHRIDEPQAYLSFLRDNPYEIDALMEELLISVTSFFRDPAAWQALADEALPHLFEEREEDETLRVWIPGCATGEEAYSTAILLEEQIRATGRSLRVQIFATDLDERAIEVARAAQYPEGISADVSRDRLRTFFTRQDGSYRIQKAVRDGVVFAVQNVISDPPFTRIDLIVCRNLLIYLDGAAQRRVLPNFHYSLRPGGLLFLGSAESIGEASNLFEVVSAKHKILRRKEVAKPVYPVLTGTSTHRASDENEEPGDGGLRMQHRFRRTVEQILLARFVPCSLVVDDRGTVVHQQGRSGMYFEPEEGPPRNSILEMAREGLGPILARGLRLARHEKREITHPSVRVRTNGGHALVDLTVSPISEPEAMRGLFLVTLRPSPPPASEGQRVGSADAGDLDLETTVDGLDLERDLQRTRESLQSTFEELETSNEELKSSNEELQSTNEELQSTNEELETSKEEMQSLNEELNTVNSELESKMEALARSNDDMNNLLNSMQVATIFLDSQMRVKRYTELARDVVRLIATDIGRPLSDLTSTLQYPRLIDDCQRVLAKLVPVEKEVQDTAGRWYLVRLMPYRTSEDVIAGVVMVIIDIDRTKRGELALQVSEDRYQALVTSSTEVLYRMSPDWSEMWQLVSREILAPPERPRRDWPNKYILPEDQPEVMAAVQEAVHNKTLFQLEHRVLRQDGSTGWVASRAVPIVDDQGEIIEWFGAFSDITERKQAEEELRRSEAKYRLLFESIDQGLCIVEVLFDEHANPVDYRFLEVNPSFEQQTGLRAATAKRMLEPAPGREQDWVETFGRIAKTGHSERFEHQATLLGHWYDVHAWRYGEPERRQVAILFNDITARKGAET